MYGSDEKDDGNMLQGHRSQFEQLPLASLG